MQYNELLKFNCFAGGLDDFNNIDACNAPCSSMDLCIELNVITLTSVIFLIQYFAFQRFDKSNTSCRVVGSLGARIFSQIKMFRCGDNGHWMHQTHRFTIIMIMSIG